ncbi:uncharacterized protein LOC123299112 [Chrysoperla carnea]|uniref:uncharacterized protein LOC123299112 n=1 Tax=Chrysoperla carnea TaxID=189513 RepID=UPI001D07995F|nr:uncharacterized protein LOC123299112 [Chrysoperla carnea]
MAERLKPTEVFDVDSIRYSNIDIQSKYEDGIENGGKWLMFIDKSKLDEVWANCCQIYDEEKLIGVSHLKCSTNFKNPRTNSHQSGAIRFYCGPASEEKKIIEIGRNILKFIPYHCITGYMIYKSNEQTKKGTRKTGQKINHLYKLQVPKREKRLSSEEVNKLMGNFSELKTCNISIKNDSSQAK